MHWALHLLAVLSNSVWSVASGSCDLCFLLMLTDVMGRYSLSSIVPLAKTF